MRSSLPTAYFKHASCQLQANVCATNNGNRSGRLSLPRTVWEGKVTALDMIWILLRRSQNLYSVNQSLTACLIWEYDWFRYLQIYEYVIYFRQVFFSDSNSKFLIFKTRSFKNIVDPWTSILKYLKMSQNKGFGTVKMAKGKFTCIDKISKQCHFNDKT